MAAAFGAAAAAVVALRLRSRARRARGPVLAYWEIRGLAQAPRLLLNYCGVDFEDRRYRVGDAPGYDKSCWLDAKESLGLAFPNLPYFVDGDVRLTQSNAILRHIARKHRPELLGRSTTERAIVDMLLDQVFDLRNGTVRVCYGKLPEGATWESVAAEYQATTLKRHLDRLEAYLAADGRAWLAGEALTVPDFHLCELLDQHKIMIPGCLDGYPRLRALSERFDALPAIAAYRASPGYLERPVNNRYAAFF